MTQASTQNYNGTTFQWQQGPCDSEQKLQEMNSEFTTGTGRPPGLMTNEECPCNAGIHV